MDSNKSEIRSAREQRDIHVARLSEDAQRGIRSTENERDVRITKERLLEYFPEESNKYEQLSVEDEGDFIEQNKWVRNIDDIAFDLQTTLLRDLGYNAGVAPTGPFKLEHFMRLSLGKRENIESLIHEMMGHCACWDYLSDLE